MDARNSHAGLYSLFPVFSYTLTSLSVSVCVSHIQMSTRTKATCEVTVVCWPELCDQPSERLCALCNQQDYSGIRGSTPQRLNIIMLHSHQIRHCNVGGYDGGGVLFEVPVRQ